MAHSNVAYYEPADTVHWWDTESSKTTNTLPSQAQLNELFDYDPETKLLYWRIQFGSRGVAGSVAGCIYNHGYRVIKINGIRYLAHRLIWKHLRGEEPPPEIDHANNDGSDSHITNLRECSHSQNMANRKRGINNKSGFKGVCKERLGYKASIMRNGTQIYLGNYSTPEQAHAAYIAKARELFGNFANPG